MRRGMAVVAPTLAVALALAGPASARAQTSAPLLVYAGPADESRGDRAARAALGSLARREATALVDLSPEPPPAPTAAVELGRGVAAYRAFEYQRALGHFGRAVAEVADTGAAGLDGAELSDLLLYRGLARAGAGDEAGGWDDFVRAATLDPTRRLDPVRFPPSVVERFARAVKAVTAAPAVELSLALPPACRVRVDGRDLGDARATLVVPGEHYLRAVCPGHRPYGSRVAVPPQPVELRPRLRALERPDLERALQLARSRGAGRVVFAALAADGDAATLTLQLARADGQVLASTSAALGEPRTAGASVVAAFDRLLEAGRLPPLLAAPAPQPTPWYRRPWVWGLAGAALTAAALVPLALDDAPDSRFELRLGGALPP